MRASVASPDIVRTLPLGVVAALIAVTALVALAGTAATRTPGTSEPIDSDAFVPLVLDRTLAAPTGGPANAGAPAPTEAALLEPGTAPVPTRPDVAQPRPRARVLVKPTPTPAPRAGGGWRTSEYSWYGPGFYGSGTACGQTYTKTILGVAHKTLPCGTRVTLRNPKNGRTITVRVIDRGPYVAGRVWDLSRGTCTYLDNCYTGQIRWRLP